MWQPKSVRVIVITVAALVVGLALCAATLVIALGVRPAAAGPNANPGAPNPGHLWTEIEGHGTDAAGWWLGTIASNALELRVNGARALRLEPNAFGPNVIGGYNGNSVTAGAYGAAIGGGGTSGNTNRVTDDYGTVGGGVNNQAGDNGGGVGNCPGTTVAGGQSNQASNMYSTVGGGESNAASGGFATVGGGWGNHAQGGDATVAGGQSNQASNVFDTVGGGETNTASGGYATVGGGWQNWASGSASTVGGGYGDRAPGIQATVGGGYGNNAGGAYATVPGGRSNAASGDYSFAAGFQAQANTAGDFVWADSTGAVLASNYSDQFLVRASGGTTFYSTAAADVGVALYSGDGSWSSFSSRDVKDNFTPVDGQQVLASLANVPITTWNYKAQDASIRHMGPMAQDLSAAFGLGEDNLHINTLDADGVALAGIQGLYQLSQEQASRIQALEDENASLKQGLDSLETRVTALEGANGTSNSASAGLFSSGLSIGWLPIGGLLVAGLVLVQRRRAGGKR